MDCDPSVRLVFLIMRVWLNDPRAYFVFKQWERYPGCYKVARYNSIENFRAWVAKTTNRFFDVTKVWNDRALEQCCTRLGIECPGPLAHLKSFSEDELICQRSW